ncbi:MAG: DPP IV N-terminal domain-containing protein [Gemmataceae bacterium]|nr:DPP IV N-terminal domain-containing protein [Gemmataceae bacterium]
MFARWIPAAVVLLACATSAPADLPRSTAESSGYKATTRHAEVLAFGKAMAAQAPSFVPLSLGKSGEGREIPLWVIAEPPVTNAVAARKSGKPVVLMIGNIHAGEVDGKEALLALSRDLATGGDRDLLKQIVVLMVPNFNADGNEKVAQGKRAEQGGPDAVGDRENSGGFDLNRDFVKLETPEVRALVKCLREWDPAVVADLHTTNGSYHRHTMTYDASRHPNAGKAGEIAAILVPAAAERMKAATGFVPFRYGNFSADRTRWETYPATPRYGVQYVGIRGKVGVLSESYSYAPFADRVKASLEFSRGICQEAAAHVEELKKLPARTGDERLALRTRATPTGEKASVLGFVEVNGKPTAQTKEYPVTVVSRVEPTLEVPLAPIYVIQPGFDKAIECLQRHGIELTQLREDLVLDAELYRVNRIESAPRAFQGHTLRRLEVAPRTESTKVPAGSVVVKTRQPLGMLAGLLLEPQSEDGLAAWNFFDAGLKDGSDYPVIRLAAMPPALTGGVRPLPEDRVMNRPVDIPLVFGNRPVSFGGNPARDFDWLEDGEHFLQTKDAQLLKVHARTGKSSPFIDRKLLSKSLRANADIAESADELSRRPSLQMDSARSAALFNHKKDLYLGFFDGSPAVRLTRDQTAGEFATLGPRSRSVARTLNGNLFVSSPALEDRRLTNDGGLAVLNGRADWVYEEEVFDRAGPAFWWSPDARRLAFIRFDDSPVHTYSVVNHIPTRLDVEKYPYPKAGDPNPTVRLGIAQIPDVSDKSLARPDTVEPTVRWVSLPGYDPGDMIIQRVGWLDAEMAYAYISNRIQTWYDIVAIPQTGESPRVLFRETTKAWVDNTGPLHTLPGGDFLFLSDRTGWRHAYRYGKDGLLRNAVTAGDWEARKILQVDAAGGWVYLLATKDSPIGTNVYRAKLDGSAIERLTPETGSHSASFNATGTMFIDTVSALESAGQVRLRAADGTLVRVLDSNPTYVREEYRLGKVEAVEVPLDDFTTQGIVVYPPDFDPTRKYPVWVKTYAGPHMPTVSDSVGAVRLDDHLLAALGIIVFKVDPRGASGRGAQSSWTSYRQLGVQELRDLETAVAWLGKNPWVDSKRIGLSGHSFGGYITAYALTHSKVFCAGVSGAPVTDWRLYDSIYTERYMGLPADNAKGYDVSSVVKAAGQLHGKLLLIHGMMDDNVHVQNSAQLIQALQRADKDFEVMVYPTSRHGIFGRHYQRQVFNFICRSLGVDARAPERGSTDGS